MNKNAKGASIDAVSARLLTHRKNGKLFYVLGDGIIRKSGRDMDFLKYEEAAHFFYRSCLAYKACGRWQEAGDSLMRGAWCYERLKQGEIAAAIFCEAAETFMKTDKSNAIDAYKAASKLYLDAKSPLISGCLERKIAQIHFVDAAWEDAAVHFSRAAELFDGEVNRNQHDFCCEREAECYVSLGKFLEQASMIYDSIAEACVRSNLRRFNARDFLFRAVLCLIGEPMKDVRAEYDDEDDAVAVFNEIQTLSEEKYNSIEWKVHEYEVTDFLWKCSKEVLFLKNILRARLAWDLEAFANHVYYWDNVRALDRYCLVLLNVMRMEIQNELEFRDKKAIRVEAAKVMKIRFDERFLEKKAAMKLLGVEIVEKDVEDEINREIGAEGSVADDGSVGGSVSGSVTVSATVS